MTTNRGVVVALVGRSNTTTTPRQNCCTIEELRVLAQRCGQSDFLLAVFDIRAYVYRYSSTPRKAKRNHTSNIGIARLVSYGHRTDGAGREAVTYPRERNANLCALHRTDARAQVVRILVATSKTIDRNKHQGRRPGEGLSVCRAIERARVGPPPSICDQYRRHGCSLLVRWHDQRSCVGGCTVLRV